MRGFFVGAGWDMSQRLVQLLESVVEDLGFELWHLELEGAGGNRLLRLYIDAPEGIVVEDCERVSREVGAALDVADPLPGAYRLEVSSPGLDRPLVKPAHFRRFLGKNAKVTLYAPIEGRRRFTGVLRDLDDESVRLEYDDGCTVALPYTAIAKARLVPEFE